MRIALLTTEALAAAVAVRRFVLADPSRLALVAISDPFRSSAGGMAGQTWRRLSGSGPRFIPYLALNFTIPRLVGLVRRGGPPERTPLAKLCADTGVPVTEVADVNGDAFRERLRASGAEFLVSFHFDQILKLQTLEAAPHGGLNVHCGRLSRHRGPTPTIHALLDPDPDWTLTLHALNPRIDAGTVLAEARPRLPPGVSALTAARLLHEAALPLLEEVLAGRAEAPAERGVDAGAGQYNSFPTWSELGRLARTGRRTTDLADLVEAWRTPI